MDQLTEQLIHGRTHVSPKRLGDPGPNAVEKEQILLAANAAPDHGRMLPWRFIEIKQASRQLLAEVFEKCLLDRDQYASELQLQEAQDKAFRGPLLLLAIADYSDDNADISKEEKLISLGCAIQNILLRSYSFGLALDYLVARRSKLIDLNNSLNSLTPKIPFALLRLAPS